MNDQYYLLLDERQEGPFTLDQLRAMWRTAALHLGTRYWKEGMPEWSILADIVGELEPPTSSPPVFPAQETPPPLPDFSPKSRIAFIVLAVTIGPLGVHNFYAGYTKRGLVQLAITVLLGWTVLPLVAMGAWNFFEAVTVKTDAQGRPFPP